MAVHEFNLVILGSGSTAFAAALRENEAVKVFAGEAHLEADLRVRVGDEILVGDRVLVATGTRPHLPSIPGLGSVPFLTSDLLGAGVPEELTDRPASLLILGAGYVALELGQLFSRLGTKVTILERGPELLHRMEPEVGPALREAFTAEGIEVLTQAHVQEVTVGGLGVRARVRIAGEARQLEAERLLVTTGREANTDELGLQEAGVELDAKGFVRVDEYLRTGNPRVFAAGDVVGSAEGSQPATPVGAHDGGIAARNALVDAQQKVDHRVIPRPSSWTRRWPVWVSRILKLTGPVTAAPAAPCPSPWSPVPRLFTPPAASSRWCSTATPARFSG